MFRQLGEKSSLNQQLDEWIENWYSQGNEAVHRRFLDFLELWRQEPGDWLEEVADDFFSLSLRLGGRDFEWVEGFGGELQKLLYANQAVWHFEDEARRDDVAAARIAELKRGIDAANQKRNDQMERLDEYVLAQVDVSEDPQVPLQSEPPGLILDRLIIMALKNFHYESWDYEAEATTLKRQREDLEGAYRQLLRDLREDRRRVKIYRQLKTYNDPEKNPVL